MKVLVVGGTGTAGRPSVAELSRRGHEVRVLSRHGAGEHNPDWHGVANIRGDVSTGAGLAEALEGVEAVVDLSNVTTLSEEVATSFFVGGARRLLPAEAAAGVRHHVLLSIIGVDVVPDGYSRAKAAQERAVAASAGAVGIGLSVLRATQFHEFAGQMIARLRRGPLVPMPVMVVQPVSAFDVAEAVADAVESELGSSGRLPDLAGDEVLGLPQMARAVLRARGERAVVVPVPLPRAVGRAMRAGAFRPAVGTPLRLGKTTFEDYLTGLRSATRAKQWRAQASPG